MEYSLLEELMRRRILRSSGNFTMLCKTVKRSGMRGRPSAKNPSHEWTEVGF
jgi:hypothetical protein